MRPLILVSNDDGIEARGVHELVKMLVRHGDVVCVCPASPQSAMSMALSMQNPLRIWGLDDFEGARMYKVNGTPVDCVKLAMHAIVERIPDLVVSGINHGSNSAINVIYSGTMGAAFEATAFGVPAIGVSLTDHSPHADFSNSVRIAGEIVSRTLKHGLPSDICLNVNVPDMTEVKGWRVVRSARGKWTDEYKEYKDPFGKDFYMLTGKFINFEPEAKDTDEWCLSHGFASVVPEKLDRTAPDWTSFTWLE